MSPKLREILDEYCRLEYEKKGSFPHVVRLPSQLFRHLSGSIYTWNAREVRFAPLLEVDDAVHEAVQEGVRNGTFIVPPSASADTSGSLPSGVSIAMQQAEERQTQQQAGFSYRITYNGTWSPDFFVQEAAEYPRCLVEGCTVCGGPRIRERLPEPPTEERQDAPSDVTSLIDTERLSGILQRTYEPLPRRRNRRS